MWFLGIDIGTTHIKVMGIAEDGALLPAQKCRTPVTQANGLTFHDARAVWQAVRDLVSHYARHEAKPCGGLAAIAIGTFGQEEAVAVDRAGEMIYPSLAWWENYPDSALSAADRAWLDTPEHYAVSGIRLRPNQSPERLAWLRRNEPALFNRIDKWADFGSYVAWRLTGEWRVSASQITHSQCFDLHTLRPHRPTLERLALRPEWFAPIAGTGDACGAIRPASLPEVELHPGAGVFVGGHDQIMAAYAVQSTQPTDVFDSIGTSEYLMVLTDRYQPTPTAWQLGIDIERTWRNGEYVMGCATPSGKMMQTLAELFYRGDFAPLFQDLAQPCAPGALQVTLGEEEHQGLFSLQNLHAGVTPQQVLYGVLDAIADRTRHLLGHMCELGAIRLQDAVLMGSLFQRPEMVAHRQARWQMPLYVSELAEPVATGAAMIAREAWLAHGEAAV
ncbi:FGGY-family carbohydrate kinase [Sodalis praecaptivus]|nr:FGGY family carbohydrate kinase [Sodalis praecaptivus]